MRADGHARPVGERLRAHRPKGKAPRFTRSRHATWQVYCADLEAARWRCQTFAVRCVTCRDSCTHHTNSACAPLQLALEVPRVTFPISRHSGCEGTDALEFGAICFLMGSASHAMRFARPRQDRLRSNSSPEMASQAIKAGGRLPLPRRRYC